MSKTILNIQEDPILTNSVIGPYRELTVTRYCGPERILKTEKTPVCIQLTLDTSQNYVTIRLTKTQALKLAEEIQNVYREMLRPEDSD